MITAVDTNIFIDILFLDEQFHQGSKDNLLIASKAGDLIVCEIVIAELSSAFFRNGRNENELSSFLLDLGVILVQSEMKALFIAGSRWNLYTSKRGNNIICPICGKYIDILCPDCKRIITWRQHIIADFYIGAHALVYADQLLTRDRGFYKRYFPELQTVY